MNVDTEMFRVVEKDGLRLILPLHSAAVSNDGWTDENLWLRSRVECVKSGDTVSQGFGKFFNLGMGPDGIRVDAQDIVEAVRDGERVVATLKYDGSCLIRSVYKGKVMFRTRGSLSYEYHEGAQKELDIFVQKYPHLLNPNHYTNFSLFFEWVTPDAQIVIKYDEPELYLIGGVHHGHRHFSHLEYLGVGYLESVAENLGIPMMEYFVIDSIKDWYNFYHEVIDHREIEGYVVRMGDDESRLVKIKAMPYITKHGLKSNLSFKSMVEFWLQHGRGAPNTIVEQLENMYDEEVVMWALPFVVEVEEAIAAWELAYGRVQFQVDEYHHWGQKDFAIKMQEVYKDDSVLLSLAFQLRKDDEVPDRMIRNFMKRFDESKSDD